MDVFWITQGEWILRIVVAGVCGALVGFERTSRGKEAGIKTHAIVSLASAMIMIISLYSGAGQYDSSRIASQIVSGVGFLGAGMIFVHKHMITGLTTAAGVWATAGIGMAIGAGMYVLGIASALVVILFQIILHKNLFAGKTDRIIITAKPSSDVFPALQHVLEKHNITLEDLEIEKTPTKIEIRFTVEFTKQFGYAELVSYCSSEEDILSVRL